MKISGEAAQAYKRRADRHKPARPVIRNMVAAFLVGGAICLLGQVIINWFSRSGMPLDDAAGPTAAIMIVVGSVLTGLGIYDELGRIGGMGAALPVTGFANSMVAPALEYKREGYVLGVGSRMFSIAGPVVVYGLLVSIASASLRFWLVGP